MLPVDDYSGLAGRFVKAIRGGPMAFSRHVRFLSAIKVVLLPLFQGFLGRTAERRQVS